MMKPPLQACHERIRIAKQRGVVLFFALIALVVMSLAAIALMRSVDTSTIVAGNLAFKQSANLSADSGIEGAITWLSTQSTATLITDSSANAALGYYATSTSLATALTADATWAAGSSAAATGNGIDASGTDSSGNTTRYVIERMCRNTGAATAASCLFGTTSVSTSGQGVKDATQAGAITISGQSPMYRVTARVTGPKNTVSYIQAFIY